MDIPNKIIHLFQNEINIITQNDVINYKNEFENIINEFGQLSAKV